MIIDGWMIVELLLTDSTEDHRWENDFGLLLTDSTDDHRWEDDCGIIAHG